MTELFLFILAIVGGMASFIAPCNVIVLPTYISYIGSQANGVKKGAFMSLLFSIGFCLTFGLISTLFIFIAGFIRYTFWLKWFSGIVIIVLSFYVFFSKSFKHTAPTNKSPSNLSEKQSNNLTNKDLPINENHGVEKEEYAPYKYEGFSGSFILGFSLGYAWIGCNTPIYISILLAVTNQADFWLGILIFSVFALGIMIPFIIIGTFIGFIRKRILVKLIKLGSKIQKVFSIIMFYIGIEILLSAYGIPGLLPFI
ncbi:MAG: cytochrome c biogenesis CcdA family protein [Promethearchaeota archaeon]|jgi:cytochrome c biogenesis protein CcdA